MPDRRRGRYRTCAELRATFKSDPYDCLILFHVAEPCLKGLDRGNLCLGRSILFESSQNIGGIV
jgi:hypothetical protein